MELALCILVKDEINRIAGCLDPVIDLVDQVVIIDTGSVDGTPDFIRQRYGIEPLSDTMNAACCLDKSELWNKAFDLAETPWILSIDADERIDPASIEHFRRTEHPPQISGYFGNWINHLDGEPAFDDYKLFFLRKGYRKLGLIHENTQTDIRARREQALWMDELTVHHYPESKKTPMKRRLYRKSLECAIQAEPDWHRYHWFLGYMDYLCGQWDSAAKWLGIAAASKSRRFPVECLNSHMILAEIQAKLGQTEKSHETLRSALTYHTEVADDFEIKINFRLQPWLNHAMQHCQEGRLDTIQAYSFAC
jgi:glycosyltransferase involved in cell wall biosynthesis